MRGGAGKESANREMSRQQAKKESVQMRILRREAVLYVNYKLTSIGEKVYDPEG